MNIYTKKQAAEFLQISRPQLDVLINTGYLIPSKLGKRTYRITEQQLMDCIELGQREQNTDFAPTFKWTQKKPPRCKAWEQFSDPKGALFMNLRDSLHQNANVVKYKANMRPTRLTLQ